MSLPYQDASSGEKAVGEMQKILQRFGCQSFGCMMDWERGELLVQFRYRNVPISVKASVNGYAAAWLKENPWSSHRKISRIDYEKKAKVIAGTAVYSILRDWIKGQTTAVETGILSFEGAFLGQVLLPTGKTILEMAQETKLLPPPTDSPA